MKTEWLSLSKGMKNHFALTLSVLLIGAGHGAFADSADELLEKGIYTEETKGELSAAVQIYQRIVDDPQADRSLVAQAQLRLGLCQLKLGNKPQAISALERLTQEFPDKDKLLALVENNMPQVLSEMVNQIERSYILEVDRSELMETAIRAIIGKLDARGTVLRTNDMEFLTTNVLAQINENLDQQIAGIGAALKVDEETKEIIATPLRNSPASRGGLKAGDRIVEIDGVALPAEKKLETAIRLLRGTPGSLVNVTAKRSGADQFLAIQLTRDTIRLSSVKGDHYKPDDTWEFMLDEQKKIGYARLTQVGRQSPSEMEAALKELQARGMKALIFDLRNNGGGSLDEAVAIADLFVDDGRILTVKSRSEEKVYEAKAEGTFSGFPMVVLVNRNTASAAEIIAACLQDHNRAVVIGERTFGQGIVRTLVKLSGGVGALKLPIAAYYRPNGKNVNRYPNSQESDDWGVRPDAGYEITFSEEELKEFEKDRGAREGFNPGSKIQFEDRQLEKAIGYVARQLEN
jgi:carboxyl-terminal processing protease